MPHSDDECGGSPLAALRRRTDAAKRFKRVDRATAVIWKMLMVAQTRFRRLNAPELLDKVYAGVRTSRASWRNVGSGRSRW